MLVDTFLDPTEQQARVDHASQTHTHSQSRQRKLRLLEGECRSDTRHPEKIEGERQQHKTLLKALEMRGFDARLLMLTCVVGGTIYKRTQDYSKDVGISPVEMKKLLRDIRLHSVEYTSKMLPFKDPSLMQKLSDIKLTSRPDSPSCSCTQRQ